MICPLNSSKILICWGYHPYEFFHCIRFSLLLTGTCCFIYYIVAYQVGFGKTSYNKNSWGESDKVMKKAIHAGHIFGDKNLISLKSAKNNNLLSCHLQRIRKIYINTIHNSVSPIILTIIIIPCVGRKSGF